MSKRENVQRYRDRKKAKGYGRIDIMLSREAYAKLSAMKKRSETWGKTVERLISGNRFKA